MGIQKQKYWLYCIVLITVSISGCRGGGDGGTTSSQEEVIGSAQEEVIESNHETVNWQNPNDSDGDLRQPSPEESPADEEFEIISNKPSLSVEAINAGKLLYVFHRGKPRPNRHPDKKSAMKKS